MHPIFELVANLSTIRLFRLQLSIHEYTQYTYICIIHIHRFLHRSTHTYIPHTRMSTHIYLSLPTLFLGHSSQVIFFTVLRSLFTVLRAHCSGLPQPPWSQYQMSKIQLCVYNSCVLVRLMPFCVYKSCVVCHGLVHVSVFTIPVSWSGPLCSVCSLQAQSGPCLCV